MGACSLGSSPHSRLAFVLLELLSRGRIAGAGTLLHPSCCSQCSSPKAASRGSAARHGAALPSGLGMCPGAPHC